MHFAKISSGLLDLVMYIHRQEQLTSTLPLPNLGYSLIWHKERITLLGEYLPCLKIKMEYPASLHLLVKVKMVQGIVLTLCNNNSPSLSCRRKLAISRYTLKAVVYQESRTSYWHRWVYDIHSTPDFPVQDVAALRELVLTKEQHDTTGRYHNSTVGHPVIERTVRR